MKAISFQLMAIISLLNLSGCAIWNTLTFSEAQHSENKQPQEYAIDYIWNFESQDNLLKSLHPNLHENFKKVNLDKAFGQCVVDPTAGPVLLLIPVAAKYLVETAIDKAKDYTDELQERGVKKYTTSLVIFDSDIGHPISSGIAGGANPRAGTGRGCLVVSRRDSADNKLGMLTVIQIYAFNEMMKFIPTYVHFNNALALTASGDEGKPAHIDVNFAIDTKVSHKVELGKGSKTVGLGLASFDIKAIPINKDLKLGKKGNYCQIKKYIDNPCPLSTKTIDLADKSSKDIEFNITVTEMGTHVDDAKKTSEMLKSLKETAGSKVEEFVKDQLN